MEAGTGCTGDPHMAGTSTIDLTMVFPCFPSSKSGTGADSGPGVFNDFHFKYYI